MLELNYTQQWLTQWEITGEQKSSKLLNKLISSNEEIWTQIFLKECL